MIIEIYEEYNEFPPSHYQFENENLEDVLSKLDICKSIMVEIYGVDNINDIDLPIKLSQEQLDTCKSIREDGYCQETLIRLLDYLYNIKGKEININRFSI